MKDLLQQIHDRSLWQVLGLYLASSWVALQVVDTLNSTVGMPQWVVSATVVLLAVGLPVVMVTAFVQKGLGRRVDGDVGRPDGAGRDLFTWRNAIVGGVVAFALLGVGTTTWLTMRAAGIGPAGTLLAKGVIGERDVILLADFENETADGSLGDVVTEALRVDLPQSATVQLADASQVADALDRMQRPADSPLTEALALEVARREGIKAVVLGEVGRAGVGYVLTARVVTPESGEILVSHREGARDDGELLDAIDALSRRLRERIGEPLSSLAAAPALAQVTTADIDALRAYSRAARLPQAEVQRRIALLEEAIALDSDFAMAWQALGIAFGNYGAEPGRVMEARTRAFELRERLTARERSAVASMYYMTVTQEPRLAIPYHQASIEADPTSSAPLNNLGEAYRDLGDLDTALELYHQAAAIDSSSITLMNLAQVGTTLGDVEAVNEVSSILDRRAPPFGEWHRAMGLSIQRDYEAHELAMRGVREGFAGSAFLMTQTTQWQAEVVAIRGKISESDDLWASAAEMANENGSQVEALRNLTARTVLSGLARRTAPTADLDRALARFPLNSMDPVERPYLDVAEAYALLGEPVVAKRLLEEFEAATPDDFQRGSRFQKQRVLGEIAQAEGRFEDAIVAFRDSGHRPQELAPMVQLAQAFDAAGQPDSARAHYERFLSSSHWLAVLPHSMFLANALERAADLEYEAGDFEAAAAYYAEFVDLWKDADPDLQPRVESARLRLEEILRDQG